MTADAILATLRAHRQDLAALGVAHAALFGSVARGDAGPDSDIDVLIEFTPGEVPDIYRFVGLQQRIADLLPGKVDVVDRGGLTPRMRDAVERDLIRAF